MGDQKTKTKEQRRARRVATLPSPRAPIAERELGALMAEVTRGASTWFGMGRMRCRRKLSNGAVVVVEIRMPALAEVAT